MVEEMKVDERPARRPKENMERNNAARLCKCQKNKKYILSLDSANWRRIIASVTPRTD